MDLQCLLGMRAPVAIQLVKLNPTMVDGRHAVRKSFGTWVDDSALAAATLVSFALFEVIAPRVPFRLALD
jgi:hypothetical protein